MNLFEQQANMEAALRHEERAQTPQTPSASSPPYQSVESINKVRMDSGLAPIRSRPEQKIETKEYSNEYHTTWINTKWREWQACAESMQAEMDALRAENAQLRAERDAALERIAELEAAHAENLLQHEITLKQRDDARAECNGLRAKLDELKKQVPDGWQLNFQTL